MIDANGTGFAFRGVEMPGLNLADGSGAEAIKAMNGVAFRVIQQRWNMNAVRLLVSVPLWVREGQPYLDRVMGVVKAANAEQLIVVLAACQDTAAGSAADVGMPDANTVAFWKAAAGALKNTPGVIFDVYNEPSARNIAGSRAGTRREEDWRVWLNGGALGNGQQTVGMQALVDAVRSTGATQVVAVSSFHDALDFQGFGPSYFVKDRNVIYQAHPTFDHALTDKQLDANLGFLRPQVPLMVGAWGVDYGSNTAACQVFPTDPGDATALIMQTLTWLDLEGVSWTVADFRPGSLIGDFTDYNPTQLYRPWACSATDGAPAGLGATVLFWTTGDPGGFGSLVPELVANAAGGPAGPVAPGEVVAFYGQGLGPEDPVTGTVDGGAAPMEVAETRAMFDGQAVPVLMTSSFQVNVQAPYEIAGKKDTEVQMFYRGVPSNKIRLGVVDTAPQLFARVGYPSEAAAINEDGSENTVARPAGRGSVVAVFLSGAGVTAPAAVTGTVGQDPYPGPGAGVSAMIGGQPAEVLFAGLAPGLVGILQVNVRIPAEIALVSAGRRTAVTVTVGAASSRDSVYLWVQ